MFTPEQENEVKQRVEQIRDALVSELQAPRASAAKALQDIEELRTDALSALQRVLRFSDNESLKAKTAMWCYEQMMAQQTNSDDPSTQFFRELAESSTPTPAQASVGHSSKASVPAPPAPDDEPDDPDPDDTH